MDRNEFLQWFERQVQTRWPKWPVNDVTLWDWHAALARFDPAALTEAVRHHLIHDDPSHPSLRKILDIVTHRRTGVRIPPPCEGPVECFPWRRLSENIPEFFDPAQREALMLSLVKFHPDPRSKDPETYDRLAAEGRLPQRIGWASAEADAGPMALPLASRL
jgi:hypothetical protein